MKQNISGGPILAEYLFLPQGWQPQIHVVKYLGCIDNLNFAKVPTVERCK
jgi:hypothetical protein